MTNPSGTANPPLTSSPRLAPFPPATPTSAARSDDSGTMKGACERVIGCPSLGSPRRRPNPNDFGIEKPPAWPGASNRTLSASADGGRLTHVDRTRTLGALLDLELDRLTAGEAIEVERELEAVAVEEVVLAVLSGDEPEAAVGDDLLDATGSHWG